MLEWTTSGPTSLSDAAPFDREPVEPSLQPSGMTALVLQKF